jgi:hypothetical protein
MGYSPTTLFFAYRIHLEGKTDMSQTFNTPGTPGKGKRRKPARPGMSHLRRRKLCPICRTSITKTIGPPTKVVMFGWGRVFEYGYICQPCLARHGIQPPWCGGNQKGTSGSF